MMQRYFTAHRLSGVQVSSSSGSLTLSFEGCDGRGWEGGYAEAGHTLASGHHEIRMQVSASTATSHSSPSWAMIVQVVICASILQDRT